MAVATRSSVSGRELAALGCADGPSAMLPASVTARPCEACGSQSPALPGGAIRTRPRRARSRIRAREIVANRRLGPGLRLHREIPADVGGRRRRRQLLRPLPFLPLAVGEVEVPR